MSPVAQLEERLIVGQKVGVWFINHDPTREFWPHRLKQMATWYGSLEHEDAKVEIAKIRAKLSVLSSGGHFLDSRGILLPEYD